MVFLCFSGHDRMTIVKSILYHLKKYGIDVWYDNHNYILGDNKENKYRDAIQSSRYAIIIFSKYFPDSPGAIEELEVIEKQHRAGLIHVFPIFYQISASAIPDKYSWLCELIYNELDESTGSLLTCNQIVSKVFDDILKQCSIKTVEEVLQFGTSKSLFVERMLESYFDIIPENINSRLTILYSLFTFIETEINLPTYLRKTVHYLFQNTKLSLEYDFKEITIMENAVCLAATQYFMNNQG